MRRSAFALRSRRSCLSLVAGAGFVCAAVTARAETVHIFRLPAEPVEVAAMRFAVQAEVSVGGLPAPGCSGRSHIVLAVTTPSDALKRLLPAGCGFERVDARAYRIVANLKVNPWDKVA